MILLADLLGSQLGVVTPVKALSQQATAAQLQPQLPPQVRGHALSDHLLELLGVDFSKVGGRPSLALSSLTGQHCLQGKQTCHQLADATDWNFQRTAVELMMCLF